MTRSARTKGFTMLELLLVVALIAVAAGMVSFSLRDPSASHLETEAARLSSLLEAARAQSRSSGLPVRWEPKPDGDNSQGFRFVGLPVSVDMPNQWLDNGVQAEVLGASALVLGPEPILPNQAVALMLNDRRIVIETDGLKPFAVATSEQTEAEQ